LTRGCWNAGPRITVGSNQFAVGRRQVDDIMAHAMLHAWLILTGAADLNESHGRARYAAVRRLSPVVLGRDLDVYRGADRRSVRAPNPAYAPDNDQPKTLVRKVRDRAAVAHDDIARWPGSLRPVGYDFGEPIPCPTY